MLYNNQPKFIFPITNISYKYIYLYIFILTFLNLKLIRVSFYLILITYRIFYI